MIGYKRFRPCTAGAEAEVWAFATSSGFFKRAVGAGILQRGYEFQAFFFDRKTGFGEICVAVIDKPAECAGI